MRHRKYANVNNYESSKVRAPKFEISCRGDFLVEIIDPNFCVFPGYAVKILQ